MVRMTLPVWKQLKQNANYTAKLSGENGAGKRCYTIRLTVVAQYRSACDRRTDWKTDILQQHSPFSTHV